MKKTLILTVLSSLALLPAQAVQKAENAEQGAKLVKNDGYALFIYGEGWDKKGKEACLKLMNDPKIQKALGDAVVMAAPLYSSPTDDQKEKIKALMTCKGLELKYPGGTETYPAIVLYSKSGQPLATVGGKDVLKGDVAKLAPKLTTLHRAIINQAELMDSAAEAKDTDKARLMLEAARIPGINRHKDINKNSMSAADKTPKKDYVFALDYYNGECGKLGEKGPDGKTLTVESYLAILDANLENELLSTEQKQNTCAFAIGLLHRTAGKGASRLVRRYARRMKELDPDTKLGRAADTVLRDWTSDGLIYTRGWDGGTMPIDDDPIELYGKLGITAGTCEVVFTPRGGRNKAKIKAVTLYDGSSKVCEDVRTCTIDKETVYTLKVPSSVARPHLFITFDVPTNERDSRGDITVRMK